jgi:riboflavin kinase
VQDFKETGIYYGYAKVMNGGDSVCEMVMSVGFNPVYGNQVRSAEVHIMKEFEDDFYGHEMRLIVLGYIRPEYNYIAKGIFLMIHC